MDLAHLAVGVAERALHGPAVAVQQLPCVLDGFGDGIAFAQEAWWQSPESTCQHQHPKTPAAPILPLQTQQELLVGSHGATGWLLPTAARWDPREQRGLLRLGGAQDG